jgi:hypothetical protein
MVNLFGVLVGISSKSRKGTSWGRINALLSAVDPVWADDRVQSGLSSGEGLIEAVRDPQSDSKDDDRGVSDKRLQVVQGEFCSVLQVMQRDGNILSAVLRDAWDSGHLRTMTRKSNALKATGAHVSIIGHITRDELRRYLSATDQANGFANRFLWFCVKRSKLLPHGAALPLMTSLTGKLGKAIWFAHGLEQPMTRDADTNRLWEKVYPQLSEGQTGMLGAVTSRAEAQVVRLSSIYALLDCSKIIRVEHLRAALAVWRYAEDSARYIFGDALGDPVADAILNALREAGEDGLTRTQLRDLFGRHKDSTRIEAALNLLREHGKADHRTQPTDGRAAEVWLAASTATKAT